MRACESECRLLNVDVDDVTMDELVESFREGMLLTLHVDMIMKLQKDREFYDLLPEFHTVTCDSQILVAAARMLGTPLQGAGVGFGLLPPLLHESTRTTRRSPSSSVAVAPGSPRSRDGT